MSYNSLLESFRFAVFMYPELSANGNQTLQQLCAACGA